MFLPLAPARGLEASHSLVTTQHRLLRSVGLIHDVSWFTVESRIPGVASAIVRELPH